MFNRLIHELNKGRDPFMDDLWDDEDDEDENEEPIADVVARNPGNPFRSIVVKDKDGNYRYINAVVRLGVFMTNVINGLNKSRAGHK